MSKTLDHWDRLKQTSFTDDQAKVLLAVMEDVLGEPLTKDMFEARISVLDERISALDQKFEGRFTAFEGKTLLRMEAFEARMDGSAKDLKIMANEFMASSQRRDLKILTAVIVTAIALIARVTFYGL